MIPWQNAEIGEPLPGVRFQYPPKIYSSEYAAKDFYETKHDEVFIGIWADGRATLCRHDAKSDLCRTLDGKNTFKNGGKIGGPRWIIPITIESAT